MVKRDRLLANLESIKLGGLSAAWTIVDKVTAKGPRSTTPTISGSATKEEDKQHAHQDACHTPPINRESAAKTRQCNFSGVGAADLRKAAAKLRGKHSKGPDGVSMAVIKKGLEALTMPLLHSINLITNSSTWPVPWREAIVVPVC